MESHSTTSDHLKLELMQLCPCGSQQVVMFVCLKSNCEDRAALPFYCCICSETLHDHRSVLIANELGNQSKKWREIKSGIDNLYSSVKQTYDE